MALNRLGIAVRAIVAIDFHDKRIFCDRRHGSPLVVGHSYGIKTPLGEKVMNRIRNRMIAAVGCALLALPSTALAGFKPSAALQSACRGDAFRLCRGSLTSMDSVAACLQAKKSQASPACQAQYDAETKATAQK